MKNRSCILYEFQNISGYVKLIICQNKENVDNNFALLLSLERDMKHSPLVLNLNGDGILRKVWYTRTQPKTSNSPAQSSARSPVITSIYTTKADLPQLPLLNKGVTCENSAALFYNNCVFCSWLQSPDRPYQCGHCPSSFPGPAELREHAVIHINEKPFKCGFCGRSFAGATTLNNHIRTHTGEKPFKCDKCHKTFSQSTQLSRHQKCPEECLRDVNTDRKLTQCGNNENLEGLEVIAKEERRPS